MKRNLWFRMYASILDPEDKTQELNDKQFRAWVRMLCAYTRGNGVFPEEKALARCLKMSVSQLRGIQALFVKLQLIDRPEDGIGPHNWDERQFESDSSTERVRAFRKRNMERSSNVSGNVTETPSENREQRTENIPPLPPEGEALSGSGSAKKRVRPTKTEPLPEPEGFAEFYQSYPRHTARSLAALAYGKHVRNGDGPKVMEALRAEMPELMRKDECYRPMPATWLNQERWRDREGISAEEDFWNPIN